MCNINKEIKRKLFQENHYIMIGTLDDTCKTLHSAMTLIDFCLPLKFACVRDTYRSMICDIAQLRNMKYELTHDDLTECFFLPRDKAVDFNYVTLDGYELRSLTVNDVDTINNLWLHRFCGSQLYLRNLILYNATLGLYNVAGNELIAWTMW